jgi:NADH-quinone oxidoreductase subunit F
MTKVLTSRFDLKGKACDIDVYLKTGGYQALEKAIKELSPEQVLEEVKKSALRGRGGAGFPTGMKWGFVPKESKRPKYLVCNADESEPGTGKDRDLMRYDPHQMIEGMIITGFTLGANVSYIYIRGEYWYIKEILEKAIDEAYKRGYLGKNILGSGFDHDMYVHPGAGAYICGEETALLESLEGKRGHPRLKPPFPAVVGLYGGPTVVNNVETLAAVPWIILNGGDAYRALGTEKSGGTKLYTVSGHVNRPGNYEVPLGYPLMRLIYEDCDGIPGSRRSFPAVRRCRSSMLKRPRSATWIMNRWRQSVRCSAPAVSSSWTIRPTSSRRRVMSRISICTNRAAGAPPAARARAGSTKCSSG